MKKNTKKTSRKTSKKKKKSTNYYKYVIIALLIVIAGLAGFLASYVYMQKEFKTAIKKQQNVIKTLEKKISKLEKETKKSPPSESFDYEQALKQIKKEKIIPPKIQSPVKTVKKEHKLNKPLLVIILDDVSFKWQTKAIKSIPYKITPSFFPPTSRHPNTPKLAQSFPVYMVHVPMQALHFNKPEPNTLNVGDSYSKIKSVIDEVKILFPRAKFINNHTGSKFTADTQSMKLLFKALKSDHIGFVDSKTTPLSKSRIAEKYYKIPLFSRNVFLDNKPDINYIQNQLKKAVEIAQKRGYAIAIGHPHKTTIEALKKSSDILKSVKVVYINELAKYTN
jgi:polysaccharide deacetylase 2 family uncharacterized protein YibQ